MLGRATGLTVVWVSFMIPGRRARFVVFWSDVGDTVWIFAWRAVPY